MMRCKNCNRTDSEADSADVVCQYCAAPMPYSEASASEARPISAIACDIASAWKRVNFAARPYLNAMMYLRRISDRFGDDSARSVIAYFLGNASSFRGEDAKRLKLELKALLK